MYLLLLIIIYSLKGAAFSWQNALFYQLFTLYRFRSRSDPDAECFLTIISGINLCAILCGNISTKNVHNISTPFCKLLLQKECYCDKL
mgnify:CR=1 FL=1